RLRQALGRGDEVLNVLREERNTEGPAALRSLRRLYVQSGIMIGALQFGAFAGAGGFVLAAATGLITGNSLYAAAAFVAGAGGVPLLILKRMRARRISTFARQLPNALDVIVRSLRAGHPLPTAIAMVGREMRDPIGSEFGMLSDELTYGLQLDEAMLHLFERVGAEDLRLVGTTLSVQRSTGGNLAEILQNLAAVIRQRFQMRAKIRALSAEGRLTAYVMTAFPFVVYVILNLIQPTYYDALWNSPIRDTVIGVCLSLIIVGDIIMFRMVNFDF